MISIVKIIQVFVISAAVLGYAGIGLVHLLAFRRLQGQALLLVPFAGLSLIISVGYWCGSSGRSAAFALVVTVLLSTVSNVIALLWRRDVPLAILPHAPALLAGTLAFALAVTPIARLGHPGPIGINGDQVLYSNVTAYLEHGGLPTPPADTSKPATLQLSFVNWGFPLGFNYVHAFVDELSGLEAHETFSLVTAVFLFLNVLALWFLSRSVFGLRLRGTILTALFAAVSPIFLWVHYNDFGMHVTSLGLVPMALGVAVLSLEERSPLAWALPALLFSAAFTSYPFATVPIAIAPLALYALLLHLKKQAPLPATLGHLAGIGVLAILLNIPGVLHVVKLLLPMFRYVLVKEFGDISEHVSWAEIYGVVHHVVSPPPFPFGLLPSLSTFSALIALGITVYGVRHMAASNHQLLFLALALAYIPPLVWFRFFLDYPYGTFKVLTSAAFAAILGFALGVERLLDRRPGEAAGSKALAWAFVTALLLANVSFSWRLAQSVAPVEISPLVELRKVKERVKDGETIHVRDDQHTDLLWTTYFLKDYNLSLAHSSPYYLGQDWPFYRKAIAADLVLVRKPGSSATTWAGEVVHENSRYQLIRKDPSVLVHLDFGERARVLRKGQSIQISVSTDRIDVDRTPSSLGISLDGKRIFLRLGVFAPEGSTISLGPANRRELMRVAQDLTVIDQPIAEFPFEITLVNEGDRNVVVPGWLEVVDSVQRRAVRPEALFQRFQEQVVPGSGVFVVDGWHALEGGNKRWTTTSSHSVFRNPSKAVALHLQGHLPDHMGIEGRVVVNNRLLGKLDKPGEFNTSFLVLPDVLGSSEWGDLGISVNRPFNPLALGLSQDHRDLGVLLTASRLRDIELPADGIINLGSETARAYLGTGWSRPERWGDPGHRGVAWGDAPESTLWFALPRPSDLIVSLTLFPLTFPSSPPQTLRVLVNGRSVAEVALTRATWRTYSLDLPRSYLSPGVNTLRFAYGFVASPSKVLPGSEDPRTLAVAFESIEFREKR
jgi:hypothetical protein